MNSMLQARTPTKNPAERRLNIRLLNYWQSLRGDRTYPSMGDFSFDAVTEFKPHAFIIEFEDSTGDAVFQFIGASLADDCGKDLMNKPVSEAPRHTLLTQVTDHYLQVLANQAPIAFEAEFENAASDEILYRSIMLPFSEDGEKIDAIVGAINSKKKPPARTTRRRAPIAAESSGGESVALRLVDGKETTATLSLTQTLNECQSLAHKADAEETRSREALYRALAAAYGLYSECQMEPEAYARMLADAGLKVQARSPFTPIVKLVFGRGYDKTRISEYATALTYAKRSNQVKITVKSFLEAQPGGIKGCVAAERLARRAERGDRTDPLEKVKNCLREQLSLAEVPDSSPGDEEFVLLLGRRDPADRNRVNVLRVLEEAPATVNAAMKRAAKALAAKSVPNRAPIEEQEEICCPLGPLVDSQPVQSKVVGHTTTKEARQPIRPMRPSFGRRSSSTPQKGPSPAANGQSEPDG